MIAMARKRCHVFWVLANLATVLLLVRCDAATGGVGALFRSGHTSSP